jgi:Ca-activated chloride channel homolog
MTFEVTRPELLYLLLLIPLWLLVVWPRRRSAPLFTRPAGEHARGLSSVRSAIILAAPRALRVLSIAALIVALAGPVSVETIEDVSSGGMAIALAVDLSTSMLAEDMGEGNRLDVARDAAMKFAQGRRDDDLALIAFAGESFTRVPPTPDEGLIVAGVQSLQVDLVRNGTDVSGAILTSLKRLTDSPRYPKVIVLLTDGAHNAAGFVPLAAARAAAAMGVRIHSIGLTPPPSGADGRRVETAGPEAETVLSAVAAVTGGRYFRAETGAALDSVYRAIDRLEDSVPVRTEREERRSERSWFLAVALLLMTVEALLRGSRWGVIP